MQNRNIIQFWWRHFHSQQQNNNICSKMNENQIEWKETVFFFSSSCCIRVQSDDRIQRKHSHALKWKLIFFVPIYLHVSVRWFRLLQLNCYNLCCWRSMRKRTTHRTGCCAEIKNHIYSFHVKGNRVVVRICLIASITKQFVVFLLLYQPKRSHSIPMNEEQVKRIDL